MQTTAGAIAFSVTSLSGLSVPGRARAATDPSSNNTISGTGQPGIASQRIDGPVKVTGGKVFARDYNARDLDGWPDTQWYGMFHYAITADHVFRKVDDQLLPEDIRPTKKITDVDMSKHYPKILLARKHPNRDLELDKRIHFLRKEAVKSGSSSDSTTEIPLMVTPGKVPDFLGQPVDLWLFDSLAKFRAASRLMQFRDAEFQIYDLGNGRAPAAGQTFSPVTNFVKDFADGNDFSYATTPEDEYDDAYEAVRKRLTFRLTHATDWVVKSFTADMRATDPVFLEPESGIVWYEEDKAALHILVGTQSPDGDISDVSEMFSEAGSPITVDSIDMICCPPGGGFGGRDSSPFTQLLALAAPLAEGHPVKIALDRFEQFRIGLKRHGTKIAGRLAADNDGKLQMLEMDLAFDGGGRKNLSPYVAQLASLCAGGAYVLPQAAIHASATQTRNVTGGSQRGFGGPQAFFALETALDDLAAEQGWDPIALRRINLAAKGDTTVVGGEIDQNLQLSEMLDMVEAHPLWANRDALKTEYNAANEDTVYGTGLAISLQAYGTSGDGVVGAVHLLEDGSVTVISDAVDMGNGSATTLGVVIAAWLGTNAANVTMADYDLFSQTGLSTDSDSTERWDDPTWTAKSVGSSSACLTGFHQVHVVRQAARAFFEFSILPAARLLWGAPDLDADGTEWKSGALVSTDGLGDPLDMVTLREAMIENDLPTGTLGHAFFQGEWATATFTYGDDSKVLELDGLSLYTNGDTTAPAQASRTDANGPGSTASRDIRFVWAPCANVVSLTVNTTTGAVEIQNVLSVLNAGKLHVPDLVSGQSQGGVAMAIGYALLEDMPPGMDGPANGTWNLQDYHLARYGDVPLLSKYAPGKRAQELKCMPEDPDDPRVGRGIAEAVMCSVAPAISNALRDATGKRFTSLPITGPKILEGLSQ